MLALFAAGISIASAQAMPGDRTLRTPPTAQDLATPARAQARLAAVEKEAAGIPERRVEFEAYMIPLRKAAAAKTAGASAGERTYWILVSAPSGPAIIRARSAQAQGQAVIVESADGKRSAWARKLILGALPGISDRDLQTLTAAQVQRVVTQYQLRAAAAPAVLRAPLLAEAERIRAGAAKQEAARAEQERALEAWLATPLKLGPSTKPSELAEHLVKGEQLREQTPAAAGRIDAAAAPWWDALRRLWAGDRFDGKNWLSGQEARTARDEEKLREARAQLLADFQLHVDGTALPPEGVRSFLQWAFGAYLVAAVFGILLLLARNAFLRIAGVLLVVGAVGLAASRYWPLLGEARKMAGGEGGQAKPVLEMLANANEDRLGFPPRADGKRVVTLSEADVNAFLHERTTFSADGGGLRRKSAAMQFLADRIIIEEVAEWNGRTLVILYEYPVRTSEKQLEPDEPRITVNGAAFSDRAARPLAESLSKAIWAADEATQINHAYRISRVTPGRIELTAFAKPLPSPTPAPTPEPTPEPTATPVPTPTPNPDAELFELLGLDAAGNPIPDRK